MQVYRIDNFGLDALQRVILPVPTVGPGMVLLHIKAVSLNYRDLLMVEGKYNPHMALPRIPCSDAAAEVIAIGEGVDTVQPGDRVCTLFFQRWMDGGITAEAVKSALGGDIDGVLAEYMVLPQEGVIKFPDHLTYEEASALPCAGLTAWNALHYAGNPASPIAPGDTILIQGTGGVSLFALQFARLFGATVYGISSSDNKLAMAAGMGLNNGLNYRETPAWSKWIAEITNRRGVDRVIEVGGAGTLTQSIESAAAGGLIAQIGVLSGGATTESIPLTRILHKQLRLQGIYVGSRAMFRHMNEAIANTQLRPVIDTVFPFDQAAAAFRLLQSGSHFGKIVINAASSQS